MHVASLFKDILYNDTKPTVTVILTSDFTKEIRLLFRKGQVMKEHTTPYPIVFEVVEGEVEFNLIEQSLDLVKGDLVALEAGIPHTLVAQEQSLVRLTLSTVDSGDRMRDAKR